MPSIYEGNKTKIFRRHLSVHETKIIRGMLMDKGISATHENVGHIVICLGKSPFYLVFPTQLSLVASFAVLVRAQRLIQRASCVVL
jgi:hypothetical protein